MVWWGPKYLGDKIENGCFNSRVLSRFKLGLHYVPGGHDNHVCPKRSAPLDFCKFFLCIQVLASFLTVYHGIRDGPWGKEAAESWRLQGAQRFGTRSTTDASTFPPGPSRSDGVPHVSHVLIKVWHVFHVLSRLATDETWTPGSFGARLCPRYKKKSSQAIAIIVSWDFDMTTSWMPTMKKILCLHVCWVHTSSLCVSKKKAISSCREGRPECSRQEEGEEGGWEGQDPCGCANSYRKTEGSSWATTQHRRCQRLLKSVSKVGTDICPPERSSENTPAIHGNGCVCSVRTLVRSHGPPACSQWASLREHAKRTVVPAEHSHGNILN